MTNTDNKNKIMKVFLMALVGLIIVGLVLTIVENNRRDSSQENSETTTSQSTTSETSTDDPEENSDTSYSNLENDGVDTGLMVSELEKFDISLSSIEDCEGVDENIIVGFYDMDLGSDDDFDRVFVDFKVANKDIVGEAKFQNFVETLEGGDLPTEDEIFTTDCGGASLSPIDTQASIETMLDQERANIFVGGYQSFPLISEPLAFTTRIIQMDENNIVQSSVLISDSSLITFSDVEGVEACEGDFAGMKGMDVRCVASLLPADTANLEKMLDAAESYMPSFR